MRAFVIAILVLAGLPGIAQADRRAVLVASIDGGPFTPGPIQARLGQTVEVRVALIDGLRVDSDVPVRLGRRARVTGPLPEGITIAWSRIEAERGHRHTESLNPGSDVFSNAVLGGPDHGAWLGLDRLEYRQSPLAGADVVVEGAVASLRAAHPTIAALDVNGGAGTVWLAAEVTLPDGAVLRTPGIADVDEVGLRPEVMRVSFRTGDDELGWLSTYFNVPFVFGSVAREVERYTGSDCADVLIGGRRRAGHDVPYVSVAGLSRVARTRTDALLASADGAITDVAGAATALRWGEDVAPGDLLTIDYLGPGDDAELPRPWDHIGALVRDDGDGVLDGDDVVRHMGLSGLVDEPLSAHGRIRLRLHRFR